MSKHRNSGQLDASEATAGHGNAAVEMATRVLKERPSDVSVSGASAVHPECGRIAWSFDPLALTALSGPSVRQFHWVTGS